MVKVDSKIFYEFEMNMSFLLGYGDDTTKKLIKDLYTTIKACHEEYMAIINASLRVINRIKKVIEKELDISRSRIHEILEDEFNQYQISQMVTLREDGFRTLEKEVEIQSISSIVMLLSLLESTLFEMISKFTNFNNGEFPEIKSVLKRDKGIAKYLKYLDGNLSKVEDNFIVGKPIYNELLHLTNLRNNIVHNSNRYNDDLYSNSLKLNIQIGHRREYNKFCFNTKSVVQLGKLVGQILNICIVEGIFQYLDVQFLEIDGFFPPIIID